MPHLTKKIVDHCASLKIANPKSARRQLREAGYSDQDAAALCQELISAVAKHRSRWTRDQVQDPLTVAARMRPLNLAKLKGRKAALAAPIAKAWHGGFRQRVLSAAEYGCQDSIDREAIPATLEAICREARKRGWTVRHTSQGCNGRASSRYITVTGHGEVRVSDHELPMTDARTDREFLGIKSRWCGEVLIGEDWRTVRLDAWMRRIILASAGRW